MRPRTRTALGIDIGARRISVALVEKEGHDFRVLAGGTSQVSGEEPGPRAEVLGRTLVQLGRHRRWRALPTAVAFSSRPTIIQLLDLPRQVPTNIGQFVEQELRQYVAMSGRDMLSDFCGIGVGPGLPKRLLAVGTDAGPVREMIHACRTAGLSVEVVEPAGLVCAATVLGGDQPPGGRADLLIGVLDAGDFTVCLFRKGVLELVRVRELPAEPSAAEDLGRWLAAELRAVLTYGGAETPADRSPERTLVLVRNAVCPPREIQRCLATEARMERATVVDADASSCLLPVARETDGVAAASEVSLAAFGAAARLLGREADDLRVNLLPAEVTRARMTSRRLLVAANVAAWVFLALLVLVQLVARTTATKHACLEETRLARQLYATPALIAQDRFVAGEMTRVRQELQRLESVRARPRVNWPSVLQTARQAVPTDVSLAQVVSADGRTVSLKGLAPSCAAAQQFVRNLDGRDPFATVALTRMERRQEGEGLLEYQVECSLQPVP